MKRGNKKGQFYLIAAMIIVAIFMGFVLVKNYVLKSDSSSLEYMAEELRYEGQKVLDYESANDVPSFEDFTEEYSSYADDEIEIYFIIGDESSGEVYSFDGETKTTFNDNLTWGPEEIVLDLHGTEHNFDLNKGKNFYFVITQEKEGELYVES